MVTLENSMNNVLVYGVWGPVYGVWGPIYGVYRPTLGCVIAHD